MLRPEIVRFIDNQHQPGFAKELFHLDLHVTRLAVGGREADGVREFLKKAGSMSDAAQADKTGSP